MLTSILATILVVSLSSNIMNREEIVEVEPIKEIQEIDIEETPEETYEIILPDPKDVETIARTLYGECRGVNSDMERAAVAWVILNRVDAGYADSILEVVSAPNQFTGYNKSHPLDSHLVHIAEDVLVRWSQEKSGVPDVGRIIPEDYYWFAGRDGRNYFRNEYRTNTYWDWSLENPYES